ncbi:MAG: hypothetical protein ACI9WS_000425 [Paraglaciecola psychrophila]|jgi:hypothetical protein
MNLDKVRARPFLLLTISDAVDDGLLTQAQMLKIESHLVDMSLKIAKSFFSPVVGHDLKKSCSIVLGVTTLGLLKLSGGEPHKARKILLEDSVIICFRKGWESVDSLFKAHGAQADRAILLTNYQYSDSEHKDIVSIHELLLAEQLDVKLLDEVAATFKNSMSEMEGFEKDEESIKADVQLSVFETLMKRHALSVTDYDGLQTLLLCYRDSPDVFVEEFNDATTAVLEQCSARIAGRIKGWFPAIHDDFSAVFKVLALENSSSEVYISFFEKILDGIINPIHFMHAYEMLLEPEKRLHAVLKMQIDTETDYQDLDDDLLYDVDISDYSDNTAIDY